MRVATGRVVEGEVSDDEERAPLMRAAVDLDG